MYVIKEVINNRNEIDPASGEEIVNLGPVYYLDYNIILIDTLPYFYYHKQEFFCFTGYPLNNILPYFVNLQLVIEEMEEMINADLFEKKESSS